MKQPIGFSQFLDAWRGDREQQFSYEGKRALFDYLEEYEEDTGEEIELDIIALCCDYSEYKSALECVKDCGYDFKSDISVTDIVNNDDREEMQEKEAREYLREHTQLIEFDSGIIIQQF